MVRLDVFARDAPATPENPSEVVFLGRPGIDIAGPAGHADGQPDLVIEITLPDVLLKIISTWDIEAPRNHWISDANPQRWWLIQASLDNERAPIAGQSRVRLCFPDPGDLKPGLVFSLRALDRLGKPVFERTLIK